MSLFSKTEVNPKMLPFIENGEGVGVVKVNGYGKASARMESYKIIFDSYEDKNPIIESVSAITYLSYKKGNFISEPKLEIGISHKKYILSGVENNDDELETFYRTILDVKNLEKEQKRSSHMGINKPVINTEDELDDTESLSDDVDIDLEKEVLNEISEEDEIVDTNTNDSIKESESVLGKLVEEDSDDDFEVLGELDEDELDVLEESKDKESLEEESLEEESLEEESLEDESLEEEDLEESQETEESETNENEESEDFEEFDEIILEQEEPLVENTDEPIVEEFDEDLEEFDEEVSDNEIDSDRIITESDEKLQNETVEETKINEEDVSDNNTIDSEVKEDVIEELQETVDSADKNPITTENVTAEIGKMKQQLYTGINNIQNELNSENQSGLQIPTHMQPDPVDQIRRYYELKEDGIITEEEFELKKKQLLDL